MDSLELAKTVAKAISEKKGQDVVIVNVAGKTVLCDYFVIASGKSTTQVKAIADNVDERLTLWKGIDPLRKEGLAEGRWAVLDYGSVIVHVFNDESRDFYHLERLWENGENIEKYVEEE
ncbi:MAG: ribosome silencing factor [Christensenellaceae bacterium]